MYDFVVTPSLWLLPQWHATLRCCMSICSSRGCGCLEAPHRSGVCTLSAASTSETVASMSQVVRRAAVPEAAADVQHRRAHPGACCSRRHRPALDQGTCFSPLFNARQNAALRVCGHVLAHGAWAMCRAAAWVRTFSSAPPVRPSPLMWPRPLM